jgi:hypothetical protein
MKYGYELPVTDGSKANKLYNQNVRLQFLLFLQNKPAARFRPISLQKITRDPNQTCLHNEPAARIRPVRVQNKPEARFRRTGLQNKPEAKIRPVCLENKPAARIRLTCLRGKKKPRRGNLTYLFTE